MPLYVLKMTLNYFRISIITQNCHCWRAMNIKIQNICDSCENRQTHLQLKILSHDGWNREYWSRSGRPLLSNGSVIAFPLQQISMNELLLRSRPLTKIFPWQRKELSVRHGDLYSGRVAVIKGSSFVNSRAIGDSGEISRGDLSLRGFVRQTSFKAVQCVCSDSAFVTVEVRTLVVK
jgi:hypothetical protein